MNAFSLILGLLVPHFINKPWTYMEITKLLMILGVARALHPTKQTMQMNGNQRIFNDSGAAAPPHHIKQTMNMPGNQCIFNDIGAPQQTMKMYENLCIFKDSRAARFPKQTNNEHALKSMYFQ